MDEEKRKAGDYEIICATEIGDREIVVGENTVSADDSKYMCAFCRKNPFFARYDDILASDDYAEIIGIYGRRIAEQAEKTRLELSGPKQQGISNAPLSAADCTLIGPNDDLNNKVVVIKPDVLRREYRSATHQLKLCIGGFGASPHSRGTACYCVDLYTGKTRRYERMDILGTTERARLPQWAQQGLETYHRQKIKERER